MSQNRQGSRSINHPTHEGVVTCALMGNVNFQKLHRRTMIACLLISLALLTACQPSPPPRIQLTPFPTMTIGAIITGDLPLGNTRPLEASGIGLSNPSTAVALVNQPTATPQYGLCPAPDATITLSEDTPSTTEATIRAIVGYLTQGGDPALLETHLRDVWQVFDEETSYLRDEIDLIGDDRGELVIGFRSTDAIGTLVIIGCRDGRYEEFTRINSDTDEIPILIWLGEMNNAPPAEVVIARRRCPDDCEYETLILSWSMAQGRFANLLDEELLTLDLPTVADYDNDEVAELIVRLENRGTSATGPLRTGINIYDWNGSAYTLSIIQLDAPRYRIQLIHEGDRLFAQQDFLGAIRLYETAIIQEDLRYWFNDGPINVDSYGLYRLILGYAVLGDGDTLSAVIAELNERFPSEEETPVDTLPVYVHLAYVFLNALLDTDDLHLACVATLRVVDERGEALSLLNRYGNRSPTYRRLDICPF